MRDVTIVGIYQTPVDRDPGSTTRGLASSAVRGVLRAGELDPSRVTGLVVGNMMGGVLDGQLHLGALVADYAGIAGVEAQRVEAACASGAAALRHAHLMVASGAHDLVVACGVECMTQVPREQVTRALATAADEELEARRGESFLSLNARLMRAYLEHYGGSSDDFAPFAINAHHNALGNPYALFHKELTLDDYRTSRVVIEPLRLYDVSPLCNGAAAIALASGDVARELLRDKPRVQVIASTVATAPVALERRPDPLHLSAVAAATERALREANVHRADLDLLELHDAYTIVTVLSLEAGGFAAPGTALALGQEGRIGPKGDLPISTLGGLKARGHPVGASGIYQAVEAFLQLCGEAGPNQVRDAELALTQSIGGTAATVINHVLRRVG